MNSSGRRPPGPGGSIGALGKRQTVIAASGDTDAGAFSGGQGRAAARCSHVEDGQLTGGRRSSFGHNEEDRGRSWGCHRHIPCPAHRREILLRRTRWTARTQRGPVPPGGTTGLGHVPSGEKRSSFPWPAATPGGGGAGHHGAERSGHTLALLQTMTGLAELPERIGSFDIPKPVLDIVASLGSTGGPSP